MGKKRKKKKSLPPRRKRMNQKGRLDSAKHWILKYEGDNIIRGYRKHYGVDWICAINELKILGVELDSDYVKKLKQSVEGNIKGKQRKKMREKEQQFEYSDERFAYIAGYTSWGFPYGVTWEELGEEPPDDDEWRQ